MITSLRLRVDIQRILDWARARSVSLALALLICWYSLATLPYLADFPTLDWAQNGIAAPAYKLATTGVYGNDLFTGFYRTETYNYEYMPLYPLLVAVSFKLFGLGVLQGRLISILCGLATVGLTFRLGKQLYDSTLGLLAAAVLCVVQLGLESAASGVPLIDLARVLRYDIMVPVWVLAACNCFYWAHLHQKSIGYLGAGVLAGCAILSHVYGGLIIAVMAAVLLWRDGWRALVSRPIYLIAAGCLLALLPWIIYILQDLAAYEGQMLRHATRFAFLQPSFYLDNLRREVDRYLSWIGGSINHPILWPRAGIWILLAGLLITNVCLCVRLWRRRSLPDWLLLVALPILAGSLAAFESYKRSQYIIVVLPFLALQIAFALLAVWRWAAERRRLPIRLLLAGLVIAALWEGSLGVAHSWEVARTTTPYLPLTQRLARSIAPGSRILIAQPFWLGLAQYQARSLNLAFILSDPQYHYTNTPSMEQVITQISPEYVVEDYNPNTFAGDQPQYAWAITQWNTLLTYLDQHCHVVDSLVTPDYGPIRVHECT